MADQTITEAIETNATSPASVTIDGNTVVAKTIGQQIIADRYVAGKTAGTSKKTGFRFFRVNDNAAY
jgi:hypothetical protein